VELKLFHIENILFLLLECHLKNIPFSEYSPSYSEGNWHPFCLYAYARSYRRLK